jgi:hypothetical protein
MHFFLSKTYHLESSSEHPISIFSTSFNYTPFRDKMCCGKEKEDPETKKQREIAELRTTIWCLTGPRAVEETIEERRARGVKMKKLIIDLSMLTGEPPEFPTGGMPAALGPVAGKTPQTPPEVSSIH